MSTDTTILSGELADFERNAERMGGTAAWIATTLQVWGSAAGKLRRAVQDHSFPPPGTPRKPPKKPRRALLRTASELFRLAGETDAAAECIRTAARLKELTPRVRHRPGLKEGR